MYSTPCPLSLTTTRQKSDIFQTVCVCSSSGCMYIVNVFTGTILGKYCFPGPVFSSPICYEHSIVVGCRDNHVYCVAVQIV